MEAFLVYGGIAYEANELLCVFDTEKAAIAEVLRLKTLAKENVQTGFDDFWYESVEMNARFVG